ncbi:MAG: hypothetical protein ACI9TV_002696 [Sulfurimonas sp.]|jgi:hypothetical protein
MSKTIIETHYMGSLTATNTDKGVIYLRSIKK